MEQRPPQAGSKDIISQETVTRASQVKLLLMDCDGVLTNGQIAFTYGPKGKLIESKQFDSQDGLGLLLCQFVGLPLGVVSGRESPCLAELAAGYHIKYLYQGFLDKEPLLERAIAEEGVTGQQVAYIGDDLVDVPLMRRVGLAAAAANARPEVKAAAHFITSRAGGSGAVREVIEVILKARGLWDKILEKYRVFPG